MNRDSIKRLWFFDFDGTLSLIVPERSKAVIHPACRELLEELVATPTERVVVLSSRVLDDLIHRVGVQGVFLGGGSGVEWCVEGKDRWVTDEKMEDRLWISRENIIPHIMELASISGIEIEDKKWSVAVHTRNCDSASKRHVAAIVENLCASLNVRIFRGPEVIEVPFLPEIGKAYGVETLCKFLKFDPLNGTVFYAGDDENDASAMEWVLRRGGIAFTVGHAPLVPGTGLVENPGALAEAVYQLFKREGKNDVEVTSCTFSR